MTSRPCRTLAGIPLAALPAGPALAHPGHLHDGSVVHLLLHLLGDLPPMAGSFGLGLVAAVAVAAVLRRSRAKGRRQRGAT